MPSSEPPHLVVRELFAGVVRVHPWCGRPIAEHPPEALLPNAPCPFPAAAPVEFRPAPVRPTVRVCGLPADPSPAVIALLGQLGAAIEEQLGEPVWVDLITTADRDDALAALDTVRRYLV